MELKAVPVSIPDGANVVIGATHFIKTVEDLYEIVVAAVPQAKFGVAFNEASGMCLVRYDGNDEALQEAAVRAAEAIGAGHIFVLFLANAFPINILNQVKACPEVCRIFCATANPLQVLVGASAQGKGILGVIDGSSPKGIEGESATADRKSMLRKFGYKI